MIKLKASLLIALAIEAPLLLPVSASETVLEDGHLRDSSTPTKGNKGSEGGSFLRGEHHHAEKRVLNQVSRIVPLVL